jgi:hypothetical protein
MKANKWTVGLAAAGIVSVPIGGHAEERMNQVWTALTSTTISGYVDTSAHWDLGSGNDFAPGFAFNSGKQDGFNLNVVKLTIEKPLDESQWAAGYKADLLFGPDANGLATQSSAIGADFGVKQAYVHLRAPVGNGLDFKMGVWDTIIGYEVFENPNNPNYTRSWAYSMEPTTHTGLLMIYQFNDMFTAQAGIANTFGPTINGRAFPGGSENESYKTYLGSVAFTAPEEWGAMSGSVLYAGVVNGNGGLTAYNQTLWYIGATFATPIEGLKFGAAFDYIGVHDAPAGSYFQDATADGTAYANAIALYTSFQASEKISLHVRGEYASHSSKLFGTVDPDGGGQE